MQRSQDISKQYHTEVHKVLNKMHIPKDIWKYLHNSNHVSMLRGLRELIVRIISISLSHILVDLIGLLPLWSRQNVDLNLVPVPGLSEQWGRTTNSHKPYPK